MANLCVEVDLPGPNLVPVYWGLEIGPVRAKNSQKWSKIVIFTVFDVKIRLKVPHRPPKPPI